MPTEKIHLLGAGGHARVAIDALLRQGWARDRIRLWTESEAQVGDSLDGVAIGRLAPATLAQADYHVCVGNNETRKRLHLLMAEVGARAISIAHPAAITALDVTIGAGSFIAAGAILGPNSTVGCCTIVNHGAVVDHDCIVGDFVHIAPGATIGGGVRVGSCTLVGAGANILPGIAVSEHSTIGAGAVLTGDVPAKSVFVGVPARRIR